MQHWRATLLATASIAALSTMASAADLPARVPVAPPVKAIPVAPAWNWAGFYIGINAGVAWNHARFTDVGDPTCCGWTQNALNTTFWSPNKAGFAAGGQAGFNLQTGSFVYGVEVDANWVDGRTTATVPTVFFPTTLTATTKLEWMASARARAGFLVLPNTLLYATGGAAFAHFKDSWSTTGPAATFSSSKTRVGWVAGGGIEHMFARNWTARIEAFYADFGSWTVVGQTGFGNYSSRFAHEVVTARGALNFKW